MSPTCSCWRCPFAAFLALWLLLTSTGLVRAAIGPLDRHHSPPGATLKTGGDLQADRMTAQGIEKGDSRQQVSVKRTGEGASANPSHSQVRGDLASQGIRNGSQESFAPTAANAARTGNAALQQYLDSGLVQIRNNPQVQAVLQNGAGRTLTYTDARGQFRLTVTKSPKTHVGQSACHIPLKIEHIVERST